MFLLYTQNVSSSHANRVKYFSNLIQNMVSKTIHIFDGTFDIKKIDRACFFPQIFE